MIGIDQPTLFAAFGALVSAIVYLYFSQNSSYKAAIARQDALNVTIREKLADCENQHKDANERIIKLTEQVGVLNGVNQIHEDIVRHLNENICARCDRAKNLSPDFKSLKG